MPLSFSFRFATRLTATLALSALGSLAAHAQTFTSMVVFGDSYNDVGNIYAISSQLGQPYPPAPYYNGRFSNGPIWVEDVASSLGLPLKPSVLGGTDYATGGAELLKSTTLQGLTIPSVEDQVGLYLATHGGKADPKALYVIEGGGNDIIDATSFSPATLGAEIAGGLAGIQQTLQAAGATNFLIPQLIDIGQFPAVVQAGPEFSAFASATTNIADRTLNGYLQTTSHAGGVNIYYLPVFKVFHAVVNSPKHNGFPDATHPCLTATFLCANPDQHLWWDDEHLTKYAHGFFAIMAEMGLVGSPIGK